MHIHRAHLWIRLCLIAGSVITGLSAFILHPPLYNPYVVEPVVKDIADSGRWQWLHVAALIGGALLAGGYTLWAWSLHERRRICADDKMGANPLFALMLSWIALSLWFPLVTFEAAGMPRVARYLAAAWPGTQQERGLIELVHGLWSAMLATAYLIAAFSGVTTLILSEAEVRSNAHAGAFQVIPPWLRAMAWLAGVGACLILPVAWSLPKWAPWILAPPGIAYFAWNILAGWRMGEWVYSGVSGKY